MARNDKLAPYLAKRDFDRTAEPRGAAESSATGRLYVVQKHAARNLHYDLRLEFDGVLKSWAVPKGPCLDPTRKPLAVQTEDHPIEYGDFEGVIPKGEYGGGTVMLWDRGEWEPIGDPVEGLARGDLKFRLLGEKLRGAWVLARMSGPPGEGGRNWLLIKKRDAEARSAESYDILDEMPDSVATGRSLAQIAEDRDAAWTDGGEQRRAERPARDADAPARAAAPDPAELPGARPATLPARLAPQLATSAPEAPAGDQWLHEIKLDGYRLLAFVRNGDVRLVTRNGHDWTDKFESVARALRRVPLEEGILDGEVVVLDRRGISSFASLQTALRGYTRANFVYYAFDAPFAGGYDLRAVPLLGRKRFLEALLRAAPLARPTVQYCDHIVGRGPTVFEQAAASDLEGIISKRLDARYESRRTDAWRKVKCVLCQDFVVGGWTQPAGSRQGFGALLLGQHDPDGELVYRGRVGTGFSDEALRRIAAELTARSRAEAPFVDARRDPDAATAHWVDPDLVARVEFTAWTSDELIRHAVFLGLRADVDARDVTAEAMPAARRARAAATGRTRVVAAASPGDASIAGVRISHPRRIVYPESDVTKLEVARYYEHVAPRMLPFVARRPLSLVRCPEGLRGESFFQRHVGKGFPKSIRGIPAGAKDVDVPYVVIDDAEGLIALAQMGVLEIHTWGCRLDDLEKPDQIIFDLDPGEGVTWEHVAASCAFVRDVLDGIGLRSFVKTSGGKGAHVVVPITRRSTWDEVKAFGHGVARHVASLAPRNFVATMSKARREHRIFIDYLRNTRGATAVAVYSTRARPGAMVSTPLAWDELSADTPPTSFTVRSVCERLDVLGDHDPWEGFSGLRQSITAKMRRGLGI